MKRLIRRRISLGVSLISALVSAAALLAAAQMVRTARAATARAVNRCQECQRRTWCWSAGPDPPGFGGLKALLDGPFQDGAGDHGEEPTRPTNDTHRPWPARPTAERTPPCAAVGCGSWAAFFLSANVFLPDRIDVQSHGPHPGQTRKSTQSHNRPSGHISILRTPCHPAPLRAPLNSTQLPRAVDLLRVVGAPPLRRWRRRPGGGPPPRRPAPGPAPAPPGARRPPTSSPA